MPLNRENRRREITLNVSPYVYDVDAVALSLINQFKADEADPEVTKLGDHKLSLTFRENPELTYEVACQKILWNQYVQNIEQKNITNNIELLKKMVDPYFDSPVVAGLNGPVNEVNGNGEGQLDGISPSAFYDGEVLWENGQPMAHPEYKLDLGIRPEGPPPLVKDINKAVEPSTITSSWKIGHETLPDPRDPEALFGHIVQHHPDIIENYSYDGAPESPNYKDVLREIGRSMANLDDGPHFYPGSYAHWQHEHKWWHGKAGLFGGPNPDGTDVYNLMGTDIPHDHN